VIVRPVWLCLLASSCAPVPIGQSSPQPHRMAHYRSLDADDCSTNQEICPAPPHRGAREPTYIPHNSNLPNY
jgi:hypothetical protein